ncbi:MAG: hypothetical protein KIS67_09805 [Verrucomicrobiae bacterium]|nr:hypothetical protein [Verrucomicrobiae bacterium]
MKVLACAFWYCVSVVGGNVALAADSAFFPVPPMQSAPWAPSASTLSTNLQSAVDFLFRTGLADPRGCEYREIEIVVGSLSRVSGVPVKTRGWVLPAATNARTNFAIGWNGLIYPLTSVGDPANAKDDARTMIRVMTETMMLNRGIGSLRGQVITTEDYCVGTQWLTPLKIALILRFAPDEFAASCVRLVEKDEPFMLLTTGRLWTMYDRATCAHMRADDDLAYHLTVVLAETRDECEAEAKSRGLQFDQRLEPDPRYSKAESYFPFLDALPWLVRDQERRHRRLTPLRDPATVADKSQRIIALIDQLENVTAQQAGYALDRDFLKNSTVQALIREGWDAVGLLIECFENDNRLTRVIPYSMFGGGRYSSRTERTIVSVREPAYVAIENILETTQFAPAFTEKETPDERQAIYRRAAAAMRDYWNQYKNLSREQRLYAILQDDQGRWFEAASIIVQPTNKACVPSGRWNYPWGLPLDLNDTSPMRGESLRLEANPSVSGLLIRRIEALAALSAGKTPAGGTVDDASDLNAACDLAICLAKWDRDAGTGTFRKLTDLAYTKLDPNKHCSLCSHMTLSAQLPVLVSLRVKAGDKRALPEYARWLKAISPDQFHLHPGQILAPIREYPNDPAWADMWSFMFQNERSQWFTFFRRISTPDPKRMSSPRFGIEEFFGSPIINKTEFRSFVIRLLRDESHCGKIVGSAKNGYWLDQRLSTARPYGYTVESSNDEEIDGKEFRTCDFYAWLISNRIEGAPAFQLYWPEDQRNAGISALKRMLKAKSGPFKTRRFQDL